MRKILWLALISTGLIGKLHAQTQYQNSGWFMFVNNTRFNEKWGLQFDAQVRSADKWGYVRNTLVRPAVQYFFNSKHNVALGYLWQTTQNQLEGASNNFLHEHRIFEQYILNHKLSSIIASHRIRVEQRFIGRVGDDVFAQRFRYFFRLIQPLKKAEASFNQGVFVALQNEVFLNFHHKDKINNSVFDQNRIYLAAGYRCSKKVDLEIGYMNQAIKNTSSYTNNNIVQLALYTRF